MLPAIAAAIAFADFLLLTLGPLATAVAAFDIGSLFAIPDGQLGPYMVRVMQIIWIDIVLSGDNAVVIALACRSLPPEQRRMGIILGAGVAVGLRVFFTTIIQSMLGLLWLKVIGGLLLIWIAVKLLTDNGHKEDENKIGAATNLFKAVQIIAIADVVMSLDNVLAIAAAARDDWRLIIFGLLLSIPLIVFGATLIGGLLQRYPVLVWAGAALLGWIAGELMVTDIATVGYAHAVAAQLGVTHHTFELICAALGAALVLAIGWVVKRRGNPPASMAST